MVLAAREQMYRRREDAPTTNANLSARDIEELIVLNEDVKDLLKISSSKLNLSPRSYHRLIKVARTIADLEGSEKIEVPHVLEALQYRVPI
jgi:magnesium chelatase family protein